MIIHALSQSHAIDLVDLQSIGFDIYVLLQLDLSLQQVSQGSLRLKTSNQ